MVRRFLDIFPPPNFLLMPTAGISISEDAIRYVQLEAGGKKGMLALTDFAEEKLQPGVIVEGIPAKPELVVAALKKLKKEHKISFAKIALPEDKAYVFKSVVAVPKGANINDSVGFILEENIPLSPAETVFDFSIVKEDKVASSDEVVVSALPQETVEQYLEICKEAGIKALQFDLESQAVTRSSVVHNDLGTKLIINFTGSKVVLAVVSKGLVQFVSMVNAELSGQADLTPLLDEVRKVCSYFSGLSNKSKVAGKVEAIIVAGEVDPKQNVVAFLSKHVVMPVSLANVWQNAFSFDETIPGLSFEDSLRFASAIGLALP